MATLTKLAPGTSAYGTAAACRAAIIAEAGRSNDDPMGRALPLVAHWHRQSLPVGTQLDWIDTNQWPVLPWIDYYKEKVYTTQELDDVETVAGYGLPLLVLIGGQPEQDFYLDSYWTAKPLLETGCADDVDGNKVNKVSPFSPVDPWTELGGYWGDNAAINALQSAYPSPPWLQIVSNNEALDLRWTEAATSKTYVDLYGTSQTNLQKRETFGDGWIDRYNAMFDGLTAELSSSWQSVVKYSSYHGAADIVFFGRWSLWRNYALITETRLDPGAYYWDGSMASIYDNDWETEKSAIDLWSMQTETMNIVFQRDEARSINANFWDENLYWDGGTAKRAAVETKYGVEYTPEFYKGWTQFCTWLTRPRCVREWRAHTDSYSNWSDYFQGIIDQVLHVHSNATLQKFWRTGTLVENTAIGHPFDEVVPTKWASINRWYRLTTSIDPAIPVDAGSGDYGLDIPIWALAYVAGTAPSREWLIYAHSTGIDGATLSNVGVTIPGYGDVTLPEVTIAGTFYHLTEAVEETYARPSSDVTTGSWVAVPSGSLYAKLDETTPDDADYIYTRSSASACEMTLSALTPPGGAASYTFSYRGRGLYTVYLKQGAGTTIASWTENDAAYTTHDRTLTPGQAALITDPSTLRVRIVSG